MKKKMIALGVAVAMAAAVGCGATAEGMEKDRFVDRYEGNGTYVYIDTETGIEYLYVDDYKAGGLTVLLNQDGTPKIAEGYETTE